MTIKPSILVALAISTAITTGTARAAEPFYAGKTLTFINGTVPGGAGDLMCRAAAQYIGKYIEGNPTIIVKNMPGADDIIADNYVGREAKPDGFTAECGPQGFAGQLFHAQGLLVDLNSFHFIAGDGGAAMIYVRADTPPGVKNAADFFKIDPKTLTYGGFSVESQKDISTRAWFDTLGLKGYKYVTGFPGDPAGRAAVQQKFLNLYQEALTSYVQVTVPTMVKTGEVIPLYQTGLVDADSHTRLRDQRVPDVPTFYEFYQAHFGKPPSGPAWELGQVVVAAVGAARDVLALPGGAPPAAIDALSKALPGLNADPDFGVAADQLLGKGVRLMDGPTVTAAVRSFLDMPPDLVKYYGDLIQSGQGMAQKKQ